MGALLLVHRSLGVGTGTMIPLLPLAIPMMMKMPFSRPVSLAFGASSLGFCVFAFVWGFQHHKGELREYVRV